MEVKLEKITPARAQQYLNRNTSNRKLRDGVVEKYASDMKTGRWTECPASIAFYDNGDVADGQHRLWAIVESETPQEFMVARGLSREAGLNIDTGVARTLTDAAKIAGLDINVNNQLVATAKAIHDGSRISKALSNAQKLDILERHRDAAEFAVSHGPRGKGLRIAVLLAAFGRAWYHEEDKEKLQRFARVLETGMTDGMHESAAVALKNYLQSKARTDVSGLWRENFLKCQNAIHYFMRGKQLTVIKGTEDERYPLPKKSAGAFKSKAV